MIIIYRLKKINGEIKAIEWDRWDNGVFLKRSDVKMTADEVIDKFDRGYWRVGTGEGGVIDKRKRYNTDKSLPPDTV